MVKKEPSVPVTEETLKELHEFIDDTCFDDDALIRHFILDYDDGELDKEVLKNAKDDLESEVNGVTIDKNGININVGWIHIPYRRLSDKLIREWIDGIKNYYHGH